MSNRIKIKQHDITDCGAACLSSIAMYYRLSVPISKIRQWATTDKKGTNVLGMTEAAEKMGFSTKAVKSLNVDGTPKTAPLYKIPKPAIAHVIIAGKLSHYVVIYGISKTWIKIMDPATGQLCKVKIDEFINEWTGILILLLPSESFKKGSATVSIFTRLMFLLKPHRKAVLQSIFGAAIFTILGLATSIYVQKIIDYIIPDGNTNLLNLLSIVMVCILFLSLFVNYSKSIFMLKTGLCIDIRLILGYYKHLLRLPQSFFDNMRTGEIISRVNDAVKIRSFINETLVLLMVNIFTIIFAFVLMFTYYWKLAVIMLLIIPLYIVIYLLYNRVNKIVQRHLMEDGADLQAQLVESIKTVGTLKHFCLEDYSDVKTELKFIKFIRTNYRSTVNSVKANTGSEMLSGIFIIILLWSGTYFVIDNLITVGELLSFYALVGYFIGPISSLVGVNRMFQDAKIAADRLFEIMDLDTECLDGKIKITKEICGDIEFDNVSFRYGSRTHIFTNLSVKFIGGTISAIVGESGSGKTTLAALIQNLYPLNDGKIRIGGIDIKYIDNNNLRSLVCIVPQNIDLFDGSIIENIVLDDTEPDIERVLAICKNVGLLDYIDRLSTGLTTNIGENGVQMSGGQRQMLAFARAIYRDPQIFILDEATSALDSSSELNIKNIVINLKKQGKTVILIAHRLGTIMNADRIFVLKTGVIVEEGTHTELLNESGEYYHFWENQTRFNNNNNESI